MQLTDIDLKGLGRFGQAPASFIIDRYHTPAPWEYQYNNGQALLRLRQDGSGFFQLSPPGGSLLLNTERNAAAPAMFTWIIPAGGRAFSNFFLPAPTAKPGSEPAEYRCEYDVEAARYFVKNGDWAVETEIFLPPGEATMVMTVKLTNNGKAGQEVTLMPVARPHLAAVALAPWDWPAWYQTVAFTKLNNQAAFWMEMRDPGGNPANRLRAALVSDLNPSTFEVSLERFVGQGRWDWPAALAEGKLARSASRHALPYGKATADNAVVGQVPMAGMARGVRLAPGKSFQFTQVLGKLAETDNGDLPAKGQVTRLMRFFEEANRQRAMKQSRQWYDDLFNQRRIDTPDEALNRYVNEYLALQLWQVMSRGWTSMRGVRDTGQDATGIVPLNPGLARSRMIEIFSMQRSDGWFLRQYSTAGKHAKHDARPYVDSGVWVWELVWEYLVWTRDFAVLKEKTDWLDSDKRDTVLEHVLRTFSYFLDKKNIGEHGLAKILEGDWNDSVNAAGLEGRGETVMVTAHLVLALKQAAQLLRYLDAQPSLARQYEAAAERFKENLLKYARNREGYFNAVFTDAGHWVFSPRDPDGKKRINSPANTFAIIAGVATGKARDKVFDALEVLRGPYGWRLFYPAIGHPPIPKLGRIGQGDLAPGIGENGCPYNHGSHGFLARAAIVAGKGDLAYQVMRYMLPYDQKAHPVTLTKSPPYLIVNNYLEAVGQEGHGGYPFQTGSIPVAARNCYEGFLGFRPELEELVIDPVMPPQWKQSGGMVHFLGGRYTIRIHNPNKVESGVKKLLLDGQPAGQKRYDERLGRQVIGIPMSTLKPGDDHEIEVTLG